MFCALYYLKETLELFQNLTGTFSDVLLTVIRNPYMLRFDYIFRLILG